jgi:hypothetical protein
MTLSLDSDYEINNHTATFIYLSFILAILIFNLWMLVDNKMYNEGTLWTLLVLMGIFYVMAMISVNSETFRLFGPIAIIISSIFLTLIAVSSEGYKRNNMTTNSDLICLGVTPLLSGIAFFGVSFWLFYRLKVQVPARL